jgi:prevent-host-death family protein
VGKSYSTYEAKAKLSEILRRVRAGDHVTISHRGQAVAELRPVYRTDRTIEEALHELEEQGVLSRHTAPSGPMGALAKRSGALKRFLETRE